MEDYLEFAKSLAKEAGEIMLKYFQVGLEYKTKADFTPVTKADEEINNLVIKRVSEKYPSHSVFGEEGSMDKNSNLVWVCDPIDGTIPFMKGLPVAVFSLALVENGKPIVGVVFDPFTNRLYSAAKDQGAFVNNEKIQVNPSDFTPNAVVQVDWWPEAKYDPVPAMHQLSKNTGAYVVGIASFIQASAQVAAGQFIAAVFSGTKGKAVDVAAIKIIVEEAGGKVTDLFGDEQKYDQPEIKGAVVSNGTVHEKVVSYLKDLKPKS